MTANTMTHFPSSIRLLLLVLLCGGHISAWASSTLTHVSGQVSILKQDGQTVAGAVGAVVQSGETVSTGGNGFARMRSSDGGWMVLPPKSQIKIESYNFEERKPSEDSFVFSLIKGALRTATGLIGKRGNRDAYAARTPTATIGIRGTQYDLRLCEENNCGRDMPDGTYVAVRDGAVAMTSTHGSVEVKAGEVAVASAKAVPVLLKEDPGIGFTTPDIFSSRTPFHGTWTGRATSAITTSPAAVEIHVQPDGQVTGTSSWNTKLYPPEVFVNAVLSGKVLTYKYKFNQDIGTAKLTMIGDNLIQATFDHGGVTIRAELTRQQNTGK